MNSFAYPSLNRAQLSYEYLHTNSTTHEFLFGAIVELVDNSRDAGAQNIHIYTEKSEEVWGQHLLYFLDDGCGMDPHEASGVITFGYSAKRMNPDMIGQYGNGLKSGAMRIGKDFILFTKKDGVLTCVFLSRSFHEKENIEEVIVPMPSFHTNKAPIIGSEPSEQEKHRLEMDLILKYSPFHTKDELLAQFDLLDSDNGTLVIIYNLKLLDSGDTELDFASDALDIRLSDPDNTDIDQMPEKVSLRAYLAVVYNEPKMKIYIRKKKVRTRSIASALYQPKLFKYSSQRFRARAEKDCDIADSAAKHAHEIAKDADCKLRDFERRNGTTPTDRNIRAELRKLTDAAADLKSKAKFKKDMAEGKRRNLRDPKVLQFVFGLNLERRSHDGVFVYNNGRLIKMYQKVGPQLDGGVNCLGVVGVVDIPYLVLEPTHNKQDFADAREYRQLLRAVGEYMEQYWRDLGLANSDGGVLDFWNQYGYLTTSWKDPPSVDLKFVKKRMMNTLITLQCDKCLKWRTVPFQMEMASKAFPDDWVCANNPDFACNKCTAPERKHSFAEGKLLKQTITVDKRRAALEKRIEKQQQDLAKLARLTTVKSRKDVTAAQEREKERKAEEDATRKEADEKKKKQAEVEEKRKRHEAEEKRRKQEAIKKKDLETKKRRAEEIKRKQEQEEAKRKATVKKAREAAAAAAAKKRSSVAQTAEAARKSKAAVVAKPRTKADLRRSRDAEALANRKRQRNGPQEESDDSSDDSETEAQPVTSKAKPASPSKPSSSAALKPKPVEAARKSASSLARASAAAASIASSNGDHSPPVTSTTHDDDVPVVPKRGRYEDEDMKVSTMEPSTSRGAPEAAVSSTNDTSRVDDLTNKFRRCLYYFLPPGYKLSKNQVSSLSTDDLLQLDLQNFFLSYESGLKLLVSEHQRATEEAQDKLASVRRMVATLLKSINPEFDIDPECNTDSVDQLLQQCVEQAAHNE